MKQLIAPAVVALGIALSPVAASASTAASTPTTTAVPAAKTTTTKTTAAKTTSTAATYEVIAGTYVHKASAEKRLAAIEKKGITGLSVVRIGRKTTHERVEERGLSRADAKAKVTALKKDGFSARYVRL